MALEGQSHARRGESAHQGWRRLRGAVYVFFDVPLEACRSWSVPELARARDDGMEVPTAAICYAWDHREAIGAGISGARTPNACASSCCAMNLQRQCGTRSAATFPPISSLHLGPTCPRVTGVAVGSDTDNTASRVTTWFGDVGSQNEAPGVLGGGHAHVHVLKAFADHHIRDTRITLVSPF